MNEFSLIYQEMLQVLNDSQEIFIIKDIFSSERDGLVEVLNEK